LPGEPPKLSLPSFPRIAHLVMFARSGTQNRQANNVRLATPTTQIFGTI